MTIYYLVAYTPNYPDDLSTPVEDIRRIEVSSRKVAEQARDSYAAELNNGEQWSIEKFARARGKKFTLRFVTAIPRSQAFGKAIMAFDRAHENDEPILWVPGMSLKNIEEGGR